MLSTGHDILEEAPPPNIQTQFLQVESSRVSADAASPNRATSACESRRRMTLIASARLAEKTSRQRTRPPLPQEWQLHTTGLENQKL